MAKETIKKWSEHSDSIFERFAAGMERYSKDGSIPKDGDQDLCYGFELQDQRLKQKNIDMEYKIIPRGQFPDKDMIGRKWKDAKYNSKMTWRTCRLERQYFRDDKKVFRHKENKVFYQTITDIHKKDLVMEDAYCCPDCAAVTKISELEKGCPYCGGRFKISDMFPKVTTSYFVLDTGFSGEELKRELFRNMFGIGAVIFLLTFLGEVALTNYFGSGEKAGNLLLTLLSSLFAGGLGGVVLGYMAFIIFRIGGSIFTSARRSLPMTPVIGSGARFVSKMKQYSPEFSYEYFSNKIVSLVKMVLFSEYPDELPVYTGELLGSTYSDIVDLSYAGAAGLKDFRVEGDDCYVTLNVFMDVLRDKGSRLSEKREKFEVEVKKNIKTPVDLGFSIRHLECKNCSMSFDATKEKCCPSCGSVYDVSEQDWVVTKILQR